MNALKILSVVLMLAILLLLIVLCVRIVRIVKRFREKDGEAALRENRRLAGAHAACCACYVVGRALFNYGVQDGASMLWSLVNGGKDVLLFAAVGIWVCYVFRKKGMALKEENQSD